MGPCHTKNTMIIGIQHGRLQENTTVVKHYGRVSETPCFPGGKLTGNFHKYQITTGDRRLLRRSIFSTAGSFGQKDAIHSLGSDLVSHTHICAIPHFAAYRAIIVRYPTTTSTKDICDTIATCIARYEKYRCWAS